MAVVLFSWALQEFFDLTNNVTYVIMLAGALAVTPPVFFLWRRGRSAQRHPARFAAPALTIAGLPASEILHHLGLPHIVTELVQLTAIFAGTIWLIVLWRRGRL
jgi:hypothetical protein